MELTEKHIKNLQALVEAPEEGILRSKLPHPRQAQYLVKHGLVEVCGVDWISHTHITDEGRIVLNEWSQTHD